MWVAPNDIAIARRLALGSTRMIVLHLAIFAPITADKPTDPPPVIKRDDPSLASKEFKTAPTPVCTPQLMGPISSSGTSSGSFTTLHS